MEALSLLKGDQEYGEGKNFCRWELTLRPMAREVPRPNLPVSTARGFTALKALMKNPVC
jgi:hypothetical protein